MAIFTQRTAASKKTIERELDAHIVEQVRQVGIGHMGTTVEGMIHSDTGERIGGYRGHVSSSGRLVSVHTFPGQGLR